MIAHPPQGPLSVPSHLEIAFSKRHKVPSSITASGSKDSLWLLDTQTILAPHVNLLRAGPPQLSIGTCTFPKKGSDIACVVHENGFTLEPRSKVSSDYIFPASTGGNFVLSGSRHGLDVKDAAGGNVAHLDIFNETDSNKEVFQKGVFVFGDTGMALSDVEKEKVIFTALAIAEHYKQTNKAWWDSAGNAGFWSSLGPAGSM